MEQRVQDVDCAGAVADEGGDAADAEVIYQGLCNI